MDTSAAWLSWNLILTWFPRVTDSVGGVMVSPVITSLRVAGEGLGCADRLAIGTGVLGLGVGAGGAGGLGVAGTGVPLIDRATAARHAWIDALSWSTIQGNPAASNSVPNRAPLLSR